MDERFVHRLEAFSDIVIGFSLAQLGASLVVRPASQLASHPGWFAVFLWTFALVCFSWWNHNRIFRGTFTPTAWALVCNFALLATVVLIVYFAQVFARPGTAQDAVDAARLYFGTLGANYLLMALLYRIATQKRGRAVLINLCGGGLLLLVVVLAPVLGNPFLEIQTMAIAVPAGFLLGVLCARRFFPREAA